MSKNQTFNQSVQVEFLVNHICVLFYCDMFCFIHPDPVHHPLCSELKKEFGMESDKSYSEDKYTFTFFRLIGKTDIPAINPIFLNNSIHRRQE
jgi:hypothetical protein